MCIQGSDALFYVNVGFEAFPEFNPYHTLQVSTDHQLEMGGAARVAELIHYKYPSIKPNLPI